MLCSDHLALRFNKF